MPVNLVVLLLLPFSLLVLVLQILLYKKTQHLCLCEDCWAGERDSCFQCRCGAALEDGMLTLGMAEGDGLFRVGVVIVVCRRDTAFQKLIPGFSDRTLATAVLTQNTWLQN